MLKQNLRITPLAMSASIALLAFTTSVKSDAYDGFYAGTVDHAYFNNPLMCEAPALDKVVVEKNRVHNSSDQSLEIRGTVFSTGYVTAQVETDQRGSNRLEGRIVDKKLVGAIITSDDLCGWIVELEKVSAPS